MVATVRALKMHGGVKKDALGKADVEALKRGMVNLEAHVRNVQKFGVPVVVALNRFTSDTQEEIDAVLQAGKGWGARAALSDVWAKGGEGGEAVAREVLAVLDEKKAAFKPLYDVGPADQGQDRDHREGDLRRGRRRLRGGGGEEHRPVRGHRAWGSTPVCMAKTQYSLQRRSDQAGPPDRLPAHHPGRLSLGGRRLRGGAGRRHHDHARTSQDAVRRGDQGPSRRHHRGPVLMPIEPWPPAGLPAPSARTARRIRAGGCLFTAGQVGFDPATGELVDGGIAEQTERVLQNIRAILEAGGCDLAQRGEDHRLPGGHGRFRGDERGLRRGLRRPTAPLAPPSRSPPCRGARRRDRGAWPVLPS